MKCLKGLVSQKTRSPLTLKLLSSALSSAGYFKSHFCKQCGPRSDCSFRSSLIWVHTVRLYAKCKFETFTRRCSRRHTQTTFSDADFLGALRVKVSFNTEIPNYCVLVYSENEIVCKSSYKQTIHMSSKL